MKEIDELNQRMDSNDEIVDSLVKKSIEMEKQVTKITDNPVPDYSIAINTILTEVREIKQSIKQNDELTLLKQIYEKLSKVPTSITKKYGYYYFLKPTRSSTIKLYLAGLFLGVYV